MTNDHTFHNFVGISKSYLIHFKHVTLYLFTICIFFFFLQNLYICLKQMIDLHSRWWKTTYEQLLIPIRSIFVHKYMYKLWVCSTARSSLELKQVIHFICVYMLLLCRWFLIITSYFRSTLLLLWHCRLEKWQSIIAFYFHLFIMTLYFVYLVQNEHIFLWNFVESVCLLSRLWRFQKSRRISIPVYQTPWISI